MNWPMVAIADLTESSQYGTSEKAGAVGALPILRMGNITYDGRLDLRDLKYIDLPDCEIEKYTARAGDILFNRTNSPDLVGKTAVFQEAQPHAFAGYLVRLRTNSRADPRYVSAYLNSPRGKTTLRSMAKSIVGMANINARELGTIRIPLPPLNEQRRIAAILDEAGALQRLRLDALQRLDDLRAAVFIEMFGDASSSDYVATAASAAVLSDIVEVRTGSTPSRTDPAAWGHDFAWVKTGEINGQEILDTEEKVSDYGRKSARLTVFPPSTILVAMYGQGKTRGRVGMLAVDATVNQACAALVPNGKIDMDFLFTQLKLSYRRLRELGRGGNQPNLNLDLVRGFRVLCPPQSDQARFSAIARRIADQRRAACIQLTHLDALFASLQLRAFSGELGRAG